MGDPRGGSAEGTPAKHSPEGRRGAHAIGARPLTERSAARRADTQDGASRCPPPPAPLPQHRPPPARRGGVLARRGAALKSAFCFLHPRFRLFGVLFFFFSFSFSLSSLHWRVALASLLSLLGRSLSVGRGEPSRPPGMPWPRGAPRCPPACWGCCCSAAEVRAWGAAGPAAVAAFCPSVGSSPPFIEWVQPPLRAPFWDPPPLPVPSPPAATAAPSGSRWAERGPEPPAVPSVRGMEGRGRGAEISGLPDGAAPDPLGARPH